MADLNVTVCTCREGVIEFEEVNLLHPKHESGHLSLLTCLFIEGATMF